MPKKKDKTPEELREHLKQLKDPNKSKDNQFRATGMQKDLPGGYPSFRTQIPAGVVKEGGEDTLYYKAIGPDGIIQLHPSGTGLPTPMEDNLLRPRRLRKKDFMKNTGAEI